MTIETGVLKTGVLLAGMTALFLLVGWLIGGAGGALVAFLVALGMNGWAYWSSDRLALSGHGARPLRRERAPELFRIVEELSQNAALPVPALYVIEEDQPNAFATGRSPEKGAVAITTGLVRALSREEMSGVIAHELAHIKSRDTLIMTIAATFSGAIAMLAQFGYLVRGRNNAAGILGVVLAALLAPLAAAVVQMLISRTREYAADRLGGEICGDPRWLASALRRIAGSRAVLESAEARPASAHLFIVNPLSGRGMDDLFATHPRTENRIAALEAQAREMERQGRVGVGGGARRPKPSPWLGKS